MEVDIVKILLSYLIPTTLSGIAGFVIARFRKIKKQDEAKEEKQKALEDGVQALLRNELIRRYREYETIGEITMLDRENIEAMFKQYEKLGGNGMVKHLKDELLELPTKVIKN